MKKIILSLFSVALFNFSDAQLKTPQASMSTSIEQIVGLTEIELEYARPSKKGRKVFGDLVPYGKIWRTGANKNTTIEFNDDVVIEAQTLKAGKYAIYTIPYESYWEVLFYYDTDNWGVPQKWDDSKVVAKTKAKVEKAAFPIETFTISFDNLEYNSAVLNFAWDEIQVGVGIQVPTDKKVEESIKKTINNNPSSQDLMAAANYYYATEKDILVAKRWMDEGMEKNEDPAFYQLYQHALINAKANDTEFALKLVQQALEASKKAGNDEYVRKCESLMNDLKTNLSSQ